MSRSLAKDQLAAYIARGLLAEDAYWAGDLQGAVELVRATIAAATAWDGDDLGPQVIRPAAVGVAALADQARLARAAGQPADALIAEAQALTELARSGVGSKRRAAAALGVDGRGWLARAEAELRRAADDNDPENWRTEIETFGPAFVYETARGRWRLAEALAEAGDRDEAQRQWQLAAATADEIGATRLRAALADLGRRARLGTGSRAVAGQPAGHPHQPRARGAEITGGRADQQRDRGRVVHLGQDRERARLEHPGQAGSRKPHCRCRDRSRQRPQAPVVDCAAPR